MRTIFFIVALFQLSFGAKAQKTDETLQVDEFLEIASNRQYAETNGFYFLKVPKEKSFKDRVSGTIILNDTNNLKIMDLDVRFLLADYSYYHLENLNLLLVLKSVNHLKSELDAKK
jgi:hypothetical protein